MQHTKAKYNAHELNFTMQQMNFTITHELCIQLISTHHDLCQKWLDVKKRIVSDMTGSTLYELQMQRSSSYNIDRH